MRMWSSRCHRLTRWTTCFFSKDAGGEMYVAYKTRRTNTIGSAKCGACHKHDHMHKIIMYISEYLPISISWNKQCVCGQIFVVSLTRPQGAVSCAPLRKQQHSSVTHCWFLAHVRECLPKPDHQAREPQYQNGTLSLTTNWRIIASLVTSTQIW